MILAMVITVFALHSLVVSKHVLTWGGVVLVYAPFLLVISWLMAFRNIARTSEHFPALTSLAFVGGVAATWGYMQGGDPLAPLLALAGFIIFLVYAWWYSSFGDRHSGRLEAGQMLPLFEIRNTAGEMISSTTLTNQPTVWMFYRGNWCPLCMAQIKELAGQYKKLEEQGVRVALVSPQPHKFTIRLAKRFDVAFDFLTDEYNQAARVLGIAHPFGIPMGMQMLGYDSETVLPTVIITAAGGRILWAHETDNYRIRPEPSILLEVLRES